MKIYDITQEIFTCVVFPGDPVPEREIILETAKGDVCNLSKFSMCAHNGTHVDAPYHFIQDGKKLDEVPLDAWIGYAYVAAFEGTIEPEDIRRILHQLKEASVTSGKKSKSCSSREKRRFPMRQLKYFVPVLLNYLAMSLRQSVRRMHLPQSIACFLERGKFSWKESD